MFAWILAFATAAAVWTITILHLWLFRRRRDETRAGLAALASLHWRDFSEIVHRALGERRGWQADPERHDDPPGADFLMRDRHSGERWMVSCKHGCTYRIGTVAVSELGTLLRLAGARGGVLVTEGKVEREGLAAAGKQSIEVLDGHRAWPILRAYLPGGLEDDVVEGARRRAWRHTVVAGIVALGIGLLAGLGWLSTHRPAAPEAPSREAVAPRPAPPAAMPAGQAASATAPVRPMQAAAEPDDATLDRYQQAVSRALTGVPGVVRGIWMTRMTLAVDRTGGDAEIWPSICRELERYPVLRTVRVQLNPRPEIDEPVRWRQCATF